MCFFLLLFGSLYDSYIELFDFVERIRSPMGGRGSPKLKKDSFSSHQSCASRKMIGTCMVFFRVRQFFLGFSSKVNWTYMICLRILQFFLSVSWFYMSSLGFLSVFENRHRLRWTTPPCPGLSSAILRYAILSIRYSSIFC